MSDMATLPVPEAATGGSPKIRPKLKWYKKLLFLAVPMLLMGLVLEVVVRASGKVRNVGPSFTTYDAEYGKRVKENLSCWRYAPEFEMELTTNSLGFRGPEPTTPPTGGIVFIGDSFTMGYGVSDGEEYPAIVREAFADRGVPIVNMGMGNNGNGRWIKYLERKVPEYEPRLVVLQLCGNDFSDNANERLYRLDDGALQELPIPPRSGMRKLQGAIESVPGLSYSYLLSFLKQSVVEWRHRSAGATAPQPKTPTVETDEPSPREQLTYALLRRAFEICRENDWPVILITVELPEKRRDAIAALCAELEQEVIFMPEKDERPDLYFEIDAHWNTAGQRHVGELLAERILRDWD